MGPLLRENSALALPCWPKPTLAGPGVTLPASLRLTEPGCQFTLPSQCYSGISRSLCFPIYTRGLAVAQHLVIRCEDLLLAPADTQLVRWHVPVKSQARRKMGSV